MVPLPMKKDYSLDLEGMRDNINFLIEAGAHGIITLGSMGEFFQLSPSEFDGLVDVVADATHGKITCTVGTSYQNLTECVRRTKYAENAGIDGAMIMVPYYLPLTQDEAFEYYRLVDEQVDDIQVVVYNFTPASRINVTPELWRKLVALESVTAVKESNAEIFHVSRVLESFGSRINVLAGSDAWLLPESILGAKGVTSIFASAFPSFVLEFYEACRKRDFEKAVPMHNAFVNATWPINPYNEVAWLKAINELAGRKAGPPRPPYFPLGGEELANLSRWVQDTRRKFGF